MIDIDCRLFARVNIWTRNQSASQANFIMASIWNSIFVYVHPYAKREMGNNYSCLLVAFEGGGLNSNFLSHWHTVSRLNWMQKLSFRYCEKTIFTANKLGNYDDVTSSNWSASSCVILILSELMNLPWRGAMRAILLLILTRGEERKRENLYWKYPP